MFCSIIIIRNICINYKNTSIWRMCSDSFDTVSLKKSSPLWKFLCSIHQKIIVCFEFSECLLHASQFRATSLVLIELLDCATVLFVCFHITVNMRNNFIIEFNLIMFTSVNIEKLLGEYTILVLWFRPLLCKIFYSINYFAAEEI